MSRKPNTIHHFTHNHPLTEVNVVGTYTCNGCKLYGYGKTYRCSDCDYDLHEYCATCPQSLTNSWHGPEHELSLINGPMHMMERMCYVCGVYIQGMFYKCKHCSFESHPLCTHGPVHPLSPDARITKQRSLHDHASQHGPYGYVHMDPYAPHPYNGHHHHHHHHHHYHQHQYTSVNPDSPKADPDRSSTSRKDKKKKEGAFGVLNAVATVTGEIGATLLVATIADSISTEE